MKENLLCAISAKNFQPSKFLAELFKSGKKPAFSLVEMLMALLVASLLMAALAPVMTRRMADSEIKVLSESANYDKDSVVTIFTDSSETKEFNIPNDVNRVTVTMMGGGGSGGNASYGNKVITSSESNWIVPDNVTKLRVFMIGAGGSGASGGSGTAWQTADIPSLSNAEGEILTAGSYTFSNGITPPDSYKAPELSNICKTASDKWVIVSNNETIAPNAKFPKFLDETEITLNKVTACGAGGGGGGGNAGGGTGGSGGYIANEAISLADIAKNVQIIVGEGGGGVGSYSIHRYSTASVPGGTGGKGLHNGTTGTSGYGTGCSDWITAGGGGGGGSTGITDTSGKITFEIAGGGGGGSGTNCYTGQNSFYSYGGKGGTGGGTNAGLGGSGGTSSQGVYKNGARATGYVAGRACYSGNQSGGGGGAGIGGTGGVDSYICGGQNAVIPNSIFESKTNCSGGSWAGKGFPGAIHLWYSTAAVKDGLKCEYYTKSNSGAGGGAGQIWIGELNVREGEKLNFNIGIGGSKTTSYGVNGNNGGSSSITNSSGTTLISVSGGKGGKYESDETYINSSYGIGGGIKTSNVDSSYAKYVNWKKTNFHNGGENGGNGRTPDNGAGGGKGGQLYNLDGVLLKGGLEGGAQSDGGDALITNYGAGGGGGGGVINDGGTPGYGGKGANGYIYVEWGGTNGGGGTMGEFVQKTVTNLEQNDRKMIISIGKGGDSSINEGRGNDTTVSVKSGGKNVVLKARGGVKGNDGSSLSGVHGEEKKYPDNYDELYKQYIQPNISTAIVSGQRGENDYGGMGGYLDCIYISKDEEGNKVCNQSIVSNDGLNTQLGPIRPGCGGSSITAPLYNSICIPYSSSAHPNGGNGVYGGGGGGGSVLNSTGGIGGKGGDGFVVLEYKSVL